MSESRSSSDNTPDLNTLSTDVNTLFFKVSDAVREALAADLSASTLSREQVASGLSMLTARPLSVAMIEAYVSVSKPHRFPAELIPAWVRVLGSRRLLDVLCGSLGLTAATQEERDFAELGRLGLKREKLTRQLWERI